MKHCIEKIKNTSLAITFAFILFLFMVQFSGCAPSKNNIYSGPFYQSILALQKPVLVDFGSTGCAPCKLMEPILEDLKQNYSHQFETIFVHVQSEPEKMKEFGVQVIPTQIFFDGNGKEIYKHVGFFSKEEILQIFLENNIITE